MLKIYFGASQEVPGLNAATGENPISEMSIYWYDPETSSLRVF
jgi:hypothetical protein